MTVGGRAYTGNYYRLALNSGHFGMPPRHPPIGLGGVGGVITVPPNAAGGATLAQGGLKC